MRRERFVTSGRYDSNRPLLFIAGVTLLFIGLFFAVSGYYHNTLFEGVEAQYRQGLVNVVSVARNGIEPVLNRVRSGAISRQEAISEIRSMVRAMTYEDQDGKNYVFMSAYDGIMLVQPFEPEKEMTNQWDLRDANGVFIIRELAAAARRYPEGSFVSYQYLLPGVHGVQEKMAYVMGLPELECYIGTGMYMARMLREQKEVAERSKYLALLMLMAALVPTSLSVLIIYRRNRQLVKEVETRKLAEETTKSSRKLMGDILRAASEFAIIATDVRGTVTVFNPGAERMLGYSSGEVVGRKSVLAFHLPSEVSERSDALTSELGRGVAGFSIFSVKPDLMGSETREWTYVRKDGTTFPVSLVITVVRSEAGEITGYLGIARDLTHQKKTEQALMENEARLASIARNIPGGVYQFCARDNGNWELTYVSEAMQEMFGVPWGKDLDFDLFRSHVHDEDRPLFEASIRRAVESCSPWKYEGRFVKPSEAVIWFHGMASPSRQEGAVVFDGILLDITERKEAEERSRLSETKFTQVFMTVPDGIVISRMADGCFMDANPGFEAISGYSRDELIGRTSYDIGIWAAPEDRRFMVNELAAGREVLYREAPFRRKDNTLRSGVYSAKKMRIGGEPCILLILLDVTDRRRLEEERQELEQQLSRSRKMEAIGKLAGGVAHDFNNLLMGIQGSAAMMLMDCRPEHPHYKKLRQIEANVERGSALTRQLLGFAREGKYEPKVVCINDLLRKNVQFFIETRKEIEADLALQEGAGVVEVDPGQMEQVFLNIFINAGHAMSQGGRLRIQTENVTLSEKTAALFQVPPGDYVKIAISDTGAGIEPEVLEKIFDPFFTTRSEEGGTGLGLASAYGIVLNHGGSIRAESIPGQGAAFTIHLPLSAKRLETAEKPAADSRILLEGQGSILVVDDEPVILEIASGILIRLGYTVHLAESAEEAVAIYRHRKDIDLVILDMILRGTSGSEVLKALKAISPGVKVLLSSGYGMQGEVKNAMAMGCVGFIQKPYNFARLSRAVRDAISSPHMPRGDFDAVDGPGEKEI